MEIMNDYGLPSESYKQRMENNRKPLKIEIDKIENYIRFFIKKNARVPKNFVDIQICKDERYLEVWYFDAYLTSAVIRFVHQSSEMDDDVYIGNEPYIVFVISEYDGLYEVMHRLDEFLLKMIKDFEK